MGWVQKALADASAFLATAYDFEPVLKRLLRVSKCVKPEKAKTKPDQRVRQIAIYCTEQDTRYLISSASLSAYSLQKRLQP